MVMIAQRKWPWVAQQNWQDVLFVHTPVPPETLRQYVPYPFEIDTYHGNAWVTVVLFEATHSRLRTMPERIAYPSFYQMNLRTYVQYGNERGVYFFSINVSDRMVQIGGRLASLPFSKACMHIKKEGDTYRFSADHLFGRPYITFDVMYAPQSAVFTPEAGSLSHFLTERYCIWIHRHQKVLKAPIYHTHWDLQDAQMLNHARAHLPFPMTHETIAHYARFKQAYIHPFEIY